MQKIEQNAARLWEMAQSLFQHPELAGEEVFASELLIKSLSEGGFTVESSVAGLPTAFEAERKGAKAGPNIALIAEYDALPKLGHACGHNLIAAMSLGAAIGLSTLMNELPGTLYVMGTPGEERGIGKIAMINAGVFDPIDAALMIHPRNENLSGRIFTAVEMIEYTFLGKASHSGSAPEHGINALDACIQLFNSAAALKKHLRDDARINGIITEGGDAANIIPDLAKAEFCIRANDTAYLQEIEEKLNRCAEGSALAAGAKYEIKSDMRLESMRHNQTLMQVFKENGSHLGLDFKPIPATGGGSTDMGNLSQVVPSIHPFIKIGPSDLELHTPAFAEAAASETAKEAMLRGAKALALTAIDLFTNEALLHSIKSEFEKPPQ